VEVIVADETTRYKLWDRIEKVYVGNDYTDKNRARSAADKKDMEYGSGRYAVDPINYKEGAWRGRNNQATNVKGGHALAERLGLASTSEEKFKPLSPSEDPEFLKRMGEIKKPQPKSGGGSGGAASDRREMQLGAEMDPKALMKREEYKRGGKVVGASQRGDGIAQRGKTRGRMV
jgi:hypothetical protein